MDEAHRRADADLCGEWVRRDQLAAEALQLRHSLIGPLLGRTGGLAARLIFFFFAPAQEGTFVWVLSAASQALDPDAT